MGWMSILTDRPTARSVQAVPYALEKREPYKKISGILISAF